MALKPGLRITQTQRLTLTPGLRQSLSVLQMTLQEIDAAIDTELAQNPLLTSKPPASTKTGGDYDLALDTVAAPVSLASHLTRQIGLMRAPKPIRDAAGYLAHMLDDNGYLIDPMAELADDLGLTPHDLDAALKLLQSCEPTGIGAQNLLDCLDLQLQSKDVTPDQRQILLTNLSDFATADWAALTLKTGLPRDRLHAYASLLQTLDPYPAARFQQVQAEYLRPEVRVLPKSDGSFTVEPLDSMTPVLAIDDALIKRARTGSEDTSAYVLEQ
jgi:RNA polymerase sigma-54 factor